MKHTSLSGMITSSIVACLLIHLPFNAMAQDAPADLGSSEAFINDTQSLQPDATLAPSLSPEEAAQIKAKLVTIFQESLDQFSFRRGGRIMMAGGLLLSAAGLWLAFTKAETATIDDAAFKAKYPNTAKAKEFYNDPDLKEAFNAHLVSNLYPQIKAELSKKDNKGPGHQKHYSLLSQYLFDTTIPRPHDPYDDACKITSTAFSTKHIISGGMLTLFGLVMANFGHSLAQQNEVIACIRSILQKERVASSEQASLYVLRQWFALVYKRLNDEQLVPFLPLIDSRMAQAFGDITTNQSLSVQDQFSRMVAFTLFALDAINAREA